MKKFLCVFMAVLMFMASVPVFAEDESGLGEFDLVSISLDNRTPKALETITYTIKTKGNSLKYDQGVILYGVGEPETCAAIWIDFYKVNSNEFLGSFTVPEHWNEEKTVYCIKFFNNSEIVFDRDTNPDLDWDSLNFSTIANSGEKIDNEAPVLQSAIVSSESITAPGPFYVDFVVTDNKYSNVGISVEYLFNGSIMELCALRISENKYRATLDCDEINGLGLMKLSNILIWDGSDNVSKYSYSGEDGAIKIDYPLDVKIISKTDSEESSDIDSTMGTDSEVVTEGSVKESKTDGAIVNDNNKNNDKVSNPNTGFGNTMWVYILSGVVLSAVIFIVYKKKVLKINK